MYFPLQPGKHYKIITNIYVLHPVHSCKHYLLPRKPFLERNLLHLILDEILGRSAVGNIDICGIFYNKIEIIS